MKVGIDAISMYTAHACLDLTELANRRGVDVNKFYTGLGQRKMSVISPSEDIVTLAANAAWPLLQQVDPATIDTVLFATESGIDMAKSAGIHVHHLLNLSKYCRVIELKQACYAGTGGLQLAAAWVARHPDKKVLLITSDVSRYALESSGESSQGCGAAAMIIGSNPRVLALEPEAGIYTDDVMDFWRPVYSDVAFVEGRYSSMIYLRALEHVWKHYVAQTQRDAQDVHYHCYHTPVPRLVEKAHKVWCKLNQCEIDDAGIQAQVADSLHYARQMGNSYAAALYIGLLSLLENHADDMSGARIGMYSYGSGCVAEYFTGIVQPGYEKMLRAKEHAALLAQRQKLTYDQYEKFYTFQLPQDGSDFRVPEHPSGRFRFVGVQDHKRLYEAV